MPLSGSPGAWPKSTFEDVGLRRTGGTAIGHRVAVRRLPVRLSATSVLAGITAALWPETEVGGVEFRPSMLKRGEIAPDFAIGETSLYEWLEERAAVVFFFPKAFTPG